MTAIQNKTKDELARDARTLDNLKTKNRERQESMKIVGGMATARVGARVLTTMVPSLAGMAPIAEIGGAGYLIYRGVTKGDGLKLGLGLGLAVPTVDRLGDFLVTAASKFKNGKG